MLLFAWLVGCAPPSPELPPAPEPVPPAVSEAVEVHDAAELAEALAGELELGSCRRGAVRVEGHIVAEVSRPAEQAWLRTLLRHESLPVAAIAAGVLFDGRVVLEGEDVAALGTVLRRLADAQPDALTSYRCRKLTGQRAEGRIWEARGDALAVLAWVEDEAAARRALEAAAEGHPELAEVGAAALGDAAAIERVTEKAFRQLCAERTWETSWMLRALDSGATKGSLRPLGMMSTGGCEYLAATGAMPTDGATSGPAAPRFRPGGGH